MMKTVPTEIDDKEKMSELMRGHLDNIGKLAKYFTLSVAGPFFDKNDRDYRDVFNFNVKSIDEADAMMETDPTVMAGVFAYESFKWYGSTALPMYLRYHGKIFKENPYIMESNYLDSVKKNSSDITKVLAIKTFQQLSDEALFWRYNEESNSLAIIVKQLWGNMSLDRFFDNGWRKRQS